MEENILDEGWYDDEKQFIRADWIVKVEMIAIVGTIIGALLGILSVFNFFGGGAISLFVYVLAYIPLNWWKKVSVSYDTSPSQQNMPIPDLLKSCRVLLILIAVWKIYTLFSVIWVLTEILPTSSTLFSTLDLVWILGILAFNGLLGCWYIYYWRVTHIAMRTINGR